MTSSECTETSSVKRSTHKSSKSYCQRNIKYMDKYILVVWKPLTQSVSWTGNHFLANFLKQQSRTWRENQLKAHIRVTLQYPALKRLLLVSADTRVTRVKRSRLGREYDTSVLQSLTKMLMRVIFLIWVTGNSLRHHLKS